MSATLAARARSDATLSMPVRRPAGRRAAPSMPARLLRWFVRRPGRGFIVLLFAAVSVLIVLNAVLFQKGRHPAPMLSPPSQSAARPAEQRRVETPVVAEPAPAPQAVMPPARPGTLAPAARDAAPRPPAPVAPAQQRQAQAAPAPARPAPAAQPVARDPIADLINGSDIRPPADIKGQRR
ncbi:conserved hypothetical protein [Bosea sp. 62]|uniref:hypothetical protein n=1 Tax=unclassified Bosea (in: a-proteobacteria) TaxID=2653178 RepID=UPI0012510681|nr:MULTISPECIES: hypothetical protein [unclassified Bosea (in: a-proteobacteria)]CAD5292922.1 conserved hypothetical protein [Bosea sp. 7B]CAD5298815.1 conserved hypothetical protein [Bosea sp. 21B]CAD5298959.1 conserved hypothetical protein [Bosea sp. 46]VVT61544.1 conserved hypothetical protein [Bosea sp. EC-HK365B]VXB10897.1 conserved hypothetical protein [Bosea sp. 127]